MTDAARIIVEEQSNTADAAKIEKLLAANSIDGFLQAAGGLLIYGATAKAGPFSAKYDKLPSQKPCRQAHPDLVAAVHDVMERTEEVYWLYVNHLALERAEALAAFSEAFLARYDQRKLDAGRLDYDDLIARASGLLSHSKSANCLGFLCAFPCQAKSQSALPAPLIHAPSSPEFALRPHPFRA